MPCMINGKVPLIETVKGNKGFLEKVTHVPTFFFYQSTSSWVVLASDECEYHGETERYSCVKLEFYVCSGGVESTWLPRLNSWISATACWAGALLHSTLWNLGTASPPQMPLIPLWLLQTILGISWRHVTDYLGVPNTLAFNLLPACSIVGSGFLTFEQAHYQ